MTIHYGKAGSSICRSNGVSTLFAAEVDVDVLRDRSALRPAAVRLL